MWRDDLSRFSLGVGKGRMVRIWYNLCMIAANSLGKPGPASWDLVGHGQIFHIKTSINCLLGQLVRSSLHILLIYYPWDWYLLVRHERNIKTTSDMRLQTFTWWICSKRFLNCSSSHHFLLIITEVNGFSPPFLSLLLCHLPYSIS